GGHGDRERLEVSAGAGAKLAVAGDEGLVLVAVLEQMVLLPDDRARHGAAGSRHGLSGGLHRDLFEDLPRNVLGGVHRAGRRVGGHDHSWRPVPARAPGAVRIGDLAVLVVEDVLTEVPDGAVVAWAYESSATSRMRPSRYETNCETSVSTFLPFHWM